MLRPLKLIASPWMPLQFTIVQKYQVFFCLTAVLPIIAFTILGFNGVYAKLNQQGDALVKSGMVLIEDALSDDYDELNLSSAQATVLAIDKAYDVAVASRDFLPFHRLLKRYQETTNFDIVMITDKGGHIVDSLDHVLPGNRRFVRTRLLETLQGKRHFGIQLFGQRSDDLQLASFSVSPIYSTTQKNKIEGALLIGNYLQKDRQFKILSKLSPDYLLRIFVNTRNGNQLEFANRLTHQNLLTPALVSAIGQTRHYTGRTQDINAFDEQINKVAYTSSTFALKNYQNDVVGYIAFSIPKKDANDLIRDNLLLVAIISFLILVFVSLVGTWFQYDFIDPMNRLALSFRKVAHGDFKIRMPLSQYINAETRTTLQDFNVMLDQLQENEHLKKNLVTTLTHDLRTPLLAQERVAEILFAENETLDPVARKHLVQALLNNNASLLELIHTLLEVYEYEEGNICLMREPIDLAALVSDCFAELSPLANQKKIRLSHTLEPSLSLLSADYKHLKRVFINLIANAIQNIPKESQIQVSIRDRRQDVTIAIRDNGQGIAPDILPHLFERYFSGHVFQKKIGTGLGLYICKMIVELHDGAIDVESVGGMGTVFYIRLPKAAVKPGVLSHE